MSAAVATHPPVQPATLPVPVTPPPAAPVGPPTHIATAELWRLSVADYHKMLEVGVLQTGDPVELLDGLLVRKMPISIDHASVAELVRVALGQVVASGWHARSGNPVTLQPRSEPEPDVSVVRGAIRDYLGRGRHPTPADTGLVVEVSYSSYAKDRGEKWAIYARDGIPVYWIVNLEETPARLEVYTMPVNGEYTQTATLTAADRADVVLDGRVVGTVAVADLLP